MIWLGRFALSFTALAALNVAALGMAHICEPTSCLLLLFGCEFGIFCIIGYCTVVGQNDSLSPLSSGALAGSLAFCAVLLCLPTDDPVAVARVLTLSLVVCHIIPFSAALFLALSPRPVSLSLTAASGIGLTLAIVESMLFFWHRCGPSLRVGIPFAIEMFQFLYWAVALPLLLLIPYRTVVLLDAIHLPEGKKREKELPSALRRFLITTAIPAAAWLLIAIGVWYSLATCRDPFSQESVGGF